MVLLDPGDRSKYVAAHGPRRGEQTRLRGGVGRGIGHLRHGRTFRKHGPREAQEKEEGFSGLMRGTPRVPVFPFMRGWRGHLATLAFWLGGDAWM